MPKKANIFESFSHSAIQQFKEAIQIIQDAQESQYLRVLLPLCHPAVQGGHSDNPRCPRKPISSSPSPTLPSSSSRRLSVSWILIRTVFSPPPTWWRPSVPMERALVVVMPRLCLMRLMAP